MVVYIYEPRYLGSRGKRILSCSPAGAKFLRLDLKNKIQNKQTKNRAVAQVVRVLD
jgi:hypothetical protein